jgi:hypothetical protein
MLALGLVLCAALIAALALPPQWAWNSTLPGIFRLPSVNYGQAFALLTLIALVVTAVKGVKLHADLKS